MATARGLQKTAIIHRKETLEKPQGTPWFTMVYLGKHADFPDFSFGFVSLRKENEPDAFRLWMGVSWAGSGAARAGSSSPLVT